MITKEIINETQRLLVENYYLELERNQYIFHRARRDYAGDFRASRYNYYTYVKPYWAVWPKPPAAINRHLTKI